jgi:transcriptional regulator with XRE-family HTH domain
MSADISDILQAYTPLFACKQAGVPGAGMANENLYQALESADLTAEDLAGLVRVDIRTVRRWLSGKPPYPRHRAQLARALKLTEQALWPDIPASTETQPRDLLTGHASTDSIAIPSPATLIQAAQGQIELLDEMLADDLLSGEVTELVIQKAQQGVSVRIMVVETTSGLASLLGQPGIELRVIEPGEHQSVHRYDDQMLITLPLVGDPDDPPPLIHIRRKGTGGLFDRLAGHIKDSWEHGTPLNSEADLRYYLAEDEVDPDPDGHPAGIDSRFREPATTAPAPSPGPVPRRWPRRPPDSHT